MIFFVKFGVQSTFIETSNIDNIEQAIQANTKLLQIESPANPAVQLTDIDKASEIANQHDILVCVDITFCSPLLQLQLVLGADIVMHSLTEFINGHAYVVGVALICNENELCGEGGGYNRR